MLGEKSSGASPKCSYLAPNSSLLRWILNIFIDSRLSSRLKKMFIKITRGKTDWSFMIVFLSDLKLVLVLQLWRQYTSSLPPSPPSTHKQKTQPTWSCKSNKSWDQYCKYNFYSPTNFSQELFVMKLVFCLQTKIGGQLGGWLGGLVTRQNLNEKMINLTTLCTFEWWEVRGLEKWTNRKK